MPESEKFRVLDVDGDISNQGGLPKRLSRIRRIELKKLHQGKDNLGQIKRKN